MSDIFYTIFQTVVVLFLMVVIASAVTSCASSCKTLIGATCLMPWEVTLSPFEGLDHGCRIDPQSCK